jgi:hypothetical protein
MIEVVRIRDMRLSDRRLIARGIRAVVGRVNRVIARRDRVHLLSGQRYEPIAGEHEARGPSLHSGMIGAIHGAAVAEVDVLLQLFCKSKVIVICDSELVKRRFSSFSAPLRLATMRP